MHQVTAGSANGDDQHLARSKALAPRTALSNPRSLVEREVGKMDSARAFPNLCGENMLTKGLFQCMGSFAQKSFARFNQSALIKDTPNVTSARRSSLALGVAGMGGRKSLGICSLHNRRQSGASPSSWQETCRPRLVAEPRHNSGSPKTTAQQAPYSSLLPWQPNPHQIPTASEYQESVHLSWRPGTRENVSPKDLLRCKGFLANPEATSATHQTATSSLLRSLPSLSNIRTVKTQRNWVGFRT